MSSYVFSPLSVKSLMTEDTLRVWYLFGKCSFHSTNLSVESRITDFDFFRCFFSETGARNTQFGNGETF